MSGRPAPQPGSEEQRLRRRRSLAIAFLLGGLAVLFYAVSMVKVLG